MKSQWWAPTNHLCLDPARDDARDAERQKLDRLENTVVQQQNEIEAPELKKSCGQIGVGGEGEPARSAVVIF